jgi:NhaC family Na+:H+ antiporter
MDTKLRKPHLWEAILPILFLIAILATNVWIFGDGSLDGSNQLALLFSAAVAGIIGLRLGYTWEHMQEGIVQSISSALSAIIILLLIGSLAGTWLLSGIVPAMIYYGLEVLNPTIFLFAACFVSAVVSLATGSSWSTIATIGIALLGIGKTLGMSEGLVAGSIISGAYFGDKMSPLSDTTNLAPAMAGTDLFTHIKYMMWTTIPSIIITLIIFLVIGLVSGGEGSVENVLAVQGAIQEKFNITGWLFLVPVAVIIMIVRKVPALPALLVGTLLGGVFALIFQPQVIAEVSGEGYTQFQTYYVAVMKAMYGDISVGSNNEIVNELLSTSGMSGMLNTIWLIVCAMVFGGVMESIGLLQRITESVIKWANSTGSLVASTALTCIGFNVTASDQYLAIVVPGRMFADTYRKRGLCPENLSRTLEDSGTVTSVLVPWNTCGATQSSVLGVATILYLPYCFFNLISPLMTMAYAYLNLKITKCEPPTEIVPPTTDEKLAHV